MIQTKLVQQTVEVEDKIFCDCCGCEINKKENYKEHLSISHSGGYYSLYPGDLQTVSFEICDECFKKTIETMGIKVRLTSYYPV